MQLINLTVYKRNDVLTTQDIAIDVDDLVGPIRFNSDDKSYFSVFVKNPPAPSKSYLQTSYQVDEDLATIKALSAKLVNLEVLERDQDIYRASEQMVFDVSRVVNNFVTVGKGTEFLYSELGAYNPVKYVVSDSITDIMAQQTSGGGASGTNTEETFTNVAAPIVLANTPLFIYGVFLNGQRLNITTDYTVLGDTITLVNAPDLTDVITVSYNY